MQHPSKPLAKTRQGTLAGSAEQGIHIWRGIPYAALARAAASRPLAGRASGRLLFRRQLAGH
ncbi:para-nitrobenzyl esterase [Klebsiella quasipneumoniae]|nr:para-nitrobenzyl esterase [Klebsiella quasipneumoniae]